MIKFERNSFNENWQNLGSVQQFIGKNGTLRILSRNSDRVSLELIREDGGRRVLPASEELSEMLMVDSITIEAVKHCDILRKKSTGYTCVSQVVTVGRVDEDGNFVLTEGGKQLEREAKGVKPKQNPKNRSYKYDYGTKQFDWMDAADDEIRNMDKETDGFWRIANDLD